MAIKLGTASPGIMLVTANGSLSPIALLDTNPIDPVSRLWSISYWPDNLVSAPAVTNATSNPATFTPPAAGEMFVVRLVRTLLVGTETLELPICVPDATGVYALPCPGIPADVDPTKTIVNLNDEAKIVGWAGAKRASLPGLAGAVRKALADAATAVSPASSVAPGTQSIDHFLRTFGQALDVKETGAIGNDTADDSTAILAAQTASNDVALSPGTYKLLTNTTFGSGKRLRPARGAIIHVPNGVTLALGNASIDAAPDQQVIQIDAGGVVTWTPVAGEIHAVWLGVKGDAIAVTGAGTENSLALQTALNAAGQLQSGAGIVRLPGGQVRFASTLNIPGGVALVGQGNGGLGTWTSLNYEGTNDTNAIEIKATPNTAGGTRVEDLFVCRTAGQGGDAIFVDCVASGGHQVSNLIVRNVSTFSGNPTLGGATAIAAGSNGASLPQATIHVADSTTFVGLNKAIVITGDGPQVVAFTGTGAGTLTGCTGGTGLTTTGNTVTAPFNFGRGLHFDGSAFDTVGHRGVRNTLVEKFRCGDCFTRLEFIRLSQVTHFVGLGIQVDTGGTGLADTSTGITIDKGTGTESANVMISGLICNGSLVLGDACRNVKIQGYVSGDLDLASTVTRCDLQLNVDGSVAIDLSATGTWVGTWAGLGGTAFVDYTDGTFNLDVAGYGRRNGKLFEPAVPSFTTTDGTTGVMLSLYIPDNCDVIVDADVAAYQATTGDGMGATQKLTIKRHGGGAAYLGTGALVNPTTQHDAGAAAWGILWGVTGNTAILQVSGENAKTIKWSASVRATYLGAMNP